MKAGDRVRVVVDDASYHEYFRVGDVGEVLRVDRNGNPYIQFEHESWWAEKAHVEVINENQ